MEEQILTLLRGYLPAAALGAALELGLFWRLADGPLSVEAVARELNVPVERCRIWLDMLLALGLLRHEGDGFGLSALAHSAIVQGYSQETWEWLAQEARERYPAGHDLALHLSYPGSVWDAQGRADPDYVAQMAADPHRARRFVQMWHELRGPLAQELAEMLDLGGARRVLDLGGGSGVVSLALLERQPALEAVVVDIANVCAAGREVADRTPVRDRILYHPADLLRDELPRGFDLVLECKVGIYGGDLFARVARALNPGGRLAIVDDLPPAGQPPALDSLRYALHNALRDPGFALPTLEHVSELLIQAGFEIVAHRTLASGDRLLQARRLSEPGGL